MFNMETTTLSSLLKHEFTAIMCSLLVSRHLMPIKILKYTFCITFIFNLNFNVSDMYIPVNYVSGRTDSSDTLFTYPSGSSHASYNDASFTPLFFSPDLTVMFPVQGTREAAVRVGYVPCAIHESQGKLCSLCNPRQRQQSG